MDLHCFLKAGALVRLGLRVFSYCGLAVQRTLLGSIAASLKGRKLCEGGFGESRSGVQRAECVGCGKTFVV